MNTKLHTHFNNTTLNLLELPSDKVLEKTSEIFKLISDPTRLKILWLLCHYELCVNNISVFSNMSPPAVSHHLKLLKKSNLIENRRDGKEMYYKLIESYETSILHNVIDDMMEIKCPACKQLETV